MHTTVSMPTAAAASSAETSARASVASLAAFSAARSFCSCCCSDSTLRKLRPLGVAVRGVPAEPALAWTREEDVHDHPNSALYVCYEDAYGTVLQ